MNSVLLEQMKLQDDLSDIMISSYADTLRMFSGLVVLISQQFMQCFAAAVFPDTPSQILDPIHVNLCTVYMVTDIRCACYSVCTRFFLSIVTN